MFSCPEFPWQLYIGRDFPVTASLKVDLESSFSKSFDFVRVPLVHPRFSKHPSIFRSQPMTRSDSCLSSQQWNNCVQGKCSAGLAPDHFDPEVQQKWARVMESELRWGVHLGVNSIVLHSPGPNCSNFARILNQFLEKGLYYQKVMIQVAVENWADWNVLRLKCGPSTALFVSLVVDTEVSQGTMDRWLGEPVHSIYLPRSVFLTSKEGVPVLSKPLQGFIQRLFKLKPNVVIGPCKDAEQLRGYVCYLFKNQPAVFPSQLTALQNFSYEFWDVSQAPLQPLMHNLESATYEIFEKDPVKYEMYEQAIFYTLVQNQGFEVIMVVGAGRGPIVKAALRASKRADRATRVYALDKNPNAIVTLYNLMSNLETGTEWAKENVRVIENDMRYWEPEEKADILVSELLGSFGDNELEPECLECAKRLLKPKGVSIPNRSINYVAPISTQKNWTNAVTNQNSAETPYVCMPNNAYIPAKSVKCFEFSYPSLNSDYSRYFKHRFQITEDCTIHGFIGYFESVLHESVLMSIKPESYSQNLVSWFPIYFPIKNPMFCENGEIELNIWRCCSNEKVWYEWEVCLVKMGKVVVNSGIHNPNGKVYWIGKA
jgi:type II protein arginine methyltransferase